MTELQSGVGDLINRLKNDGVKAGESEKSRIVDAARKEAATIVADAKLEAKRIIDDANAEKSKVEGRLKAELKLAARDFVASFRQRFAKQIVRPTVNDAIKTAMNDPGFLADTVSTLVVDYVKAGGQSVSVVVNEHKRAALTAFLMEKIGAAANNGGVTVVGQDGINGFRLKKSGESFVWDMSDDAVSSELAVLVEPALRQAFVSDEK